MGEHYKEREFEIRLSKVEKLLENKCRELDELKNYVTIVENQILRGKSERQQSIEDLRIKIEHIQQRLDQIDIRSDPEISFDIPPSAKILCSSLVEKVHKDILLIGDSIIKHIDTKKISNKQTDLVCMPGARCDDILNKLAVLLKNTEYDRILLHVGTNSIPSMMQNL
jgi:hypothetical protein